jgi:hypothetical protein
MIAQLVEAARQSARAHRNSLESHVGENLRANATRPVNPVLDVFDALSSRQWFEIYVARDPLIQGLKCRRHQPLFERRLAGQNEAA